MAAKRPNLVQVELIPSRQPTLETQIADAIDRVHETGRAQTVLRFYDVDGTVSAFVEKRNELGQQDLAAWRVLSGRCNPFIRRLWLMRAERLRRPLRRMDAERVPLALEAIRKTLSRGGDIALESNPKEPLRFLAQDEVHELLEQAVKASYAMFYVLERDEPLLSTRVPDSPVYHMA